MAPDDAADDPKAGPPDVGGDFCDVDPASMRAELVRHLTGWPPDAESRAPERPEPSWNPGNVLGCATLFAVPAVGLGVSVWWLGFWGLVRAVSWLAAAGFAGAGIWLAAKGRHARRGADPDASRALWAKAAACGAAAALCGWLATGGDDAGTMTAAETSRPPREGRGIGVPSLPDEFRSVARVMAPGLAEVGAGTAGPAVEAEEQALAALHSVVLALRSVESADADLGYVAAQGAEAAARLVRHSETLAAMPKPEALTDVAVATVLWQLVGNPQAASDLADGEDRKMRAFLAEVEGFRAAVHKLESVRLLLPAVAEKYAPPFGASAGVVKIDFTEAGWAADGGPDRIELTNAGGTLRDCTCAVDLKAADGRTVRNVHFVEEWPGGSTVSGRYEPGRPMFGKPMPDATLPGVRRVTVSLWSPGHSERAAIVYDGAERDADIRAFLSGLRWNWAYQPFEAGFLTDTQRGVRLAPVGISKPLPKCRLSLDFEKDGQARSWHWELDGWAPDESKSFATPKGGLEFDPDTIRIGLAFPGQSPSFRHDAVIRRDGR